MCRKLFAVTFPGQGSQRPGMGKELHGCSAAARSTFDEVGSALGFSVRDLCFLSDDETLRQTENAQVALFTVSVAAFRALTELLQQNGAEMRPVAMAGHSVGEYAALVCAEIIPVAHGAELVQRRGELMADAGARRPGSMAAVLGLEDELIERVCGEVSRAGSEVVVANYNCPGQVVISGDSEAVSEACGRLKDAGAKRCLPLNVSGAFHSPLMQNAAKMMGEAVRRVSFRPALQMPVPVIANVSAEPVGDAAEWPALLQRQLISPVRWIQSVRRMRSMGAELFLECGSGEVLSGLLKRIDSDASASAVHDGASLAAAVGVIAERNK